MKLLISFLTFVFLLTSCGTSYKYQAQKNSAQFKGQSIQALQKQWGQADQIIQTRSGSTYYAYLSNSTANFFNSTTTNFSSNGDSGFVSNPQSSSMTLKCTTIFTANAKGIITNVTHQGANCGGEWVPQAAKKS